MANPRRFSENLRAALDRAPQSRYQISKDTGIAQSQLSRFLHNQKGLTMANLDLLCEYLGLELVSRDSQATQEKVIHDGNRFQARRQGEP